MKKWICSYYFLLLLVLASCESPSQKVESPDLLGLKILELFKKGDGKKISQYLITKEEVKKVFEDKLATATLTDKEKDTFFTDIYEYNRTNGQRFIDMYVSEEYKKEGILKNAVYESISTEAKDENGTSITRIRVFFSSSNQKYQLILDAAKVANYYKLLSWIEVKKGY